MKIRSDFVSNSSSCSFIIDTKANVRKTIDVISSTFNTNDIVPSMAYGVTVSLSVKNKDFAEVETCLTGSSNFKMTYENYKTHEICEKDPEGIGWDSIYLSVEQIIKAFSKNADILNKIETIRFDCDDYEYDARSFLNLLYNFFERHGCNPDDSDTEHDFRTNEQSEFIDKLMS